MYKVFLTIRYLTRKKIVIFPVLVVWLCVMMLIIVASIMGGFVDRVKEANHDLFGDIIISTPAGSRGFAGYDELRHSLEQKFPEIEATTPVVEAYALLYVPEVQRTVLAQLVGVNAAERTKVNKFRESLFLQYEAPMKAVETLSKRLPGTEKELAEYALGLRTTGRNDLDAADEALRKMDSHAYVPAPQYWGLVGIAMVVVAEIFLWPRGGKKGVRRGDGGGRVIWMLLVGVVGTGVSLLVIFWPVIFPRQYELAEDRGKQAQMAMREAERTLDYANALPAGTYKTREDLVKALVPATPGFGVPEAAKVVFPGDPEPPEEGCIVGAQIGFLTRDTRGNFVHYYPQRYPTIKITVYPTEKNGGIDVKGGGNSKAFTMVDDSHSGVYDVDSLDVYAPLETVQVMAGMRADPDAVKAGGTDFPPRCHQVLIRLKPGVGGDLRYLRSKISDEVDAFAVKYSAKNPGSFPGDVLVQTWDEKQARYLGAVENEKKMMTFVMGLMSLVVLVVIFLIFYQIVRDKTRDIGIIKAVGGSEEGVAGIFLTFGLAIGLVGGGLGVISGVAFVTHTNEIHEWIYQMTGIIIWDRSVYLFDRIPDVVHSFDVVLYFVTALLAGLFGALIPAILAGAEDPVKAVRYE